MGPSGGTGGGRGWKSSSAAAALGQRSWRLDEERGGVMEGSAATGKTLCGRRPACARGVGGDDEGDELAY